MKQWAIGTSPRPDGLGLSDHDFWRCTRRKFDALFETWEDARYREDLRAALIRLDIRNAWFVGEGHPDAWTLEELLSPPSRNGKVSRNTIEQAWFDCRPEPTPARIAQFQALKMKSAAALKMGKWTGPEVWPLPS